MCVHWLIKAVSCCRYPTFLKPYLACLHSSPITSSFHCHNCPNELWEKIIEAGKEQKTDEYSSKVRTVILKCSFFFCNRSICFEQQCSCIHLTASWAVLFTHLRTGRLLVARKSARMRSWGTCLSQGEQSFLSHLVDVLLLLLLLLGVVVDG